LRNHENSPLGERPSHRHEETDAARRDRLGGGPPRSRGHGIRRPGWGRPGEPARRARPHGEHHRPMANRLRPGCLDYLGASGHELDLADVARLSPLGYPSINLQGRYRTTSRAPSGGLRHLRRLGYRLALSGSCTIPRHRPSSACAPNLTIRAWRHPRRSSRWTCEAT
jgi:hypothetical protein